MTQPDSDIVEQWNSTVEKIRSGEQPLTQGLGNGADELRAERDALRAALAQMPMQRRTGFGLRMLQLLAWILVIGASAGVYVGFMWANVRLIQWIG